MIVIYPSKSEKEKRIFISSVFILICFFCIILIVLSLIAFFSFSNYINDPETSPSLTLAICLAGIAYLIKEYFVRLAFNDRKEHIALYIHSSIFITISLLFICEYYFNGNLNLPLAFFIYALGHFMGVLIGLIFTKISIGELNQKRIAVTVKELWKDGKWGSLTNIVYFLRIQAHTIISTFLLGPAGVGLLNASRLLVTPATMTIPVVSQLAIPRLSSLREKSKLDVIKKGWLLAILLVILSIVYSFILLAFYNSISSVFFNKSYSDLFFTTFLWCIYVIIISVRNGGDMTLQILQKFKFLSFLNLLSATITILGALLFGYWFGLNGILLGLILGELFLSFSLLKSLRKTKRDMKSST